MFRLLLFGRNLVVVGVLVLLCTGRFTLLATDAERGVIEKCLAHE
jgi:hypothetical protein